MTMQNIKERTTKAWKCHKTDSSCSLLIHGLTLLGVDLYSMSGI